ncbi:nitroreductase family protein [Chloroflexota bacterium]
MGCKLRRIFYCLALVVCVVSLLFGVADSPAFSSPPGSLPEPIITGNSLEICLNSRYTVHPPNGDLSDQQLSNIMWAAAMVPFAGDDRTIYVTTVNGTYLYNSDNNSLGYYSSEDTVTGAHTEADVFLNYDRELPFDEGASYIAAINAAVSLWDSSESPVMSGPRGDGVYFGVSASENLTDNMTVTSSNFSLPDPIADGDNTIEEVLANLNYTDNFTGDNLTLQQISQLLWAGYGVSDHIISGKYPLTVPSAWADYYLTKGIYMVNENGAYRYYNRVFGGYNFNTKDHKIVETVSGDVRADLQSAVPDLPEAPCYVVISLDYDYIANRADAHSTDNATIENNALLEAGFVASNILAQASELGLGAHFEPELTAGEAANVTSIIGITAENTTSKVIVSIGNPAQTRTLASYKDDTHINACDNFTSYSTEHIAYMYGTNLLASHNYRVAYYDGDDDNVYTHDVSTGASGNLSSQRTFNEGTDTAGTWNVIVCERYLTPPTSYNGSWAFINASDSFIVEQSAIPEFPTVVAAIVALSLCVGIYLWMRRKAVPVPT